MLFPLYDRNPHFRFPWVTLLLIGANVFFFWQSVQLGDRGYIQTVYEHGFIPQRLTRLGEEKPVAIEREIKDGQGNPAMLTAELSTDPSEVYPTLVTMMFLHGGWFHLISNMWMLWVFGNNIEDRLGKFIFALFYLLSGLIAVLAQWAIDPMSTQPVIGASGAVAGVLGAYLLTFPSAKVRTLLFLGFPLLLDMPAYLVLGAWFILQVVAGVQGLGAPADANVSVAFWAHIGGFVAGIILMPLLAIGAAPPGEDWQSESQEMFDF